MFSLFSRARKDDEDNASLPSANNDAITTTASAKPVESTDSHMTTAQRIDAHFAKIAEEEAEKTLRGENGKRNLIFNPHIKPSDEAWLKVKTDIIAELAAKRIEDVVKSQHEVENGDMLLLVPATIPGIIREMQDRNDKDYKTNLAPGGRFHGQADNLVTKLIMLKFGLPIAPLTLNNILNGADYPDRDDPPDDPKKNPRFQKIEFSEKPLEFLDTYNERSYGWKILRRKTPSQPTTTAIKKRKYNCISHIRGGNLVPTEPKPKVHGYIYSHLGGRAEVSEDVNSFVENSLRLLGIDSESDWKFVVETYNNNPIHQNKTWNPPYAKGPAGHSLVTKNDTSSWDEKICDRVFHPKGVWRMAVRPADDKPAPGHLSAAIVDGVGKLHDEQPTPVSGSDIKTTVLAIPGVGRNEEVVDHGAYIWAYADPDKPEHFCWLDAANSSYESFLTVVLDNLGFDRSGDWEFQIGLYYPVDPDNPYEWQVRSGVVLSSDDLMAQDKYERDVVPNIYSSQQDWGAFVALLDQALPEPFWYKDDEIDVNFNQDDQGDFEDINHGGAGDDSANDEIDFTNDVNDEDNAGRIVIDLTNTGGDESDESGSYDDEENGAGGDDAGEDDASDSDTDNASLPEDEYHTVLALANNKPVTIENNDSFVAAVLANFGKSKFGRWAFTVDRYSCPRSDLTAELESSFAFSAHSLENQFNEEILFKAQDKTRNWCFVARPSIQAPLSTFEISEISEPETPVVLGLQGTIYGYAGQLLASHDPKSILGAIHSLLGLNAKGNWSFVVDVHGGKRIVESVPITSKTWSEAYEKVIGRSIKEGKQIFVRRTGERVSTSLEAPESLDLIYLLYPTVGIAYWKVPKQMDVGYGINQPQSDFRRAMQVFFPGQSRPAQNVFVAEKLLGFGSIDLTSELWDLVRQETATSWSNLRDKKALDPAMPGSPQCFLLEIVLTDVPAIGDEIFPVHYVGASQFGHARIPLMAREIENLGKNHVADKKLPKSYRIWKTAHDRQTRAPGQVLSFGSSTANIKALENWYYHSGSSQYPTCFEFSAEWESIELIELETTGKSVSWKWDTKGKNSTLESFYESIKSHYGDKIKIGKQSIEIYEPQSENRFILASDIDEHHWKIDVYDWISTTRLQIQPIDDVKYSIDKSTPWALPIHLLATFGSKPTTSKAKAPTGNSTSTAKSTKTTQARRAPLDIFPPKMTAKFNKDRVNLGFKVSRKVPPPWNEWQAEQNVLDKLQNSTYLAPQPIIEPGLAPDAPLFAESRELALGAGQHTPTVYASVLTPTDSRHLREQNRKLMNQVLDRTSSCAICNTTFEMYKNEAKQEHYNLHRQAVDSAGVCVLCEDKNWKFWTAGEKRQHLYEHQARDEGRIAKSFWAGFECPGCDLDLATLGDKHHILKHVLAHDPLTVKFCDRCGKSYKSCSAAELARHDRICIEGPDREPDTDPPAFCKGCGVNTTNMTEDEDKVHGARAITCFTKDAFCTTCGFDMTDLASRKRSKHVATCKTPGGLHKAYCCRCGQDFANLTGHARKDHSKFCKSAMNMEPDIIRHANVRFKEIDAHIQINHENDAKRRKANYSLHQREKKVKADEAALKRREATSNAKVNPLGIYPSTPIGSHGLVQDSVHTPETTNYGLMRDPVRYPITPASMTRTIRIPVETFKCPLSVLSDDGSPKPCGQTISLSNSGAELAKHYEHIGSEGVHGPNSQKAKGNYPFMEQKTQEYTDIINNLDSSSQLRTSLGSSGSTLGVPFAQPTPTRRAAGQTITPTLTSTKPTTDTISVPGDTPQIVYIDATDSDDSWDLVNNYVPINEAWDAVRQKIIDHSTERSAKQALGLLQAWEIAYASNQAVLRDIENITTLIEQDNAVTRPQRSGGQLYEDSLDTHYPSKNGKEDAIDDAIKTMTNVGLLPSFDTFDAPRSLKPDECAQEALIRVDFDKVWNRIKGMEIDHKNDAKALNRLWEVRHVIKYIHPQSAGHPSNLQPKLSKTFVPMKPSTKVVYYDTDEEFEPAHLTDEQKIRSLERKAVEAALNRPRAHEHEKAKAVYEAKSKAKVEKEKLLALEDNDPDDPEEVDEDGDDGDGQGDEDDLVPNEIPYLIAPRKDPSKATKKKWAKEEVVDKEPRYHVGVAITSTKDIVIGKLIGTPEASPQPETVTHPSSTVKVNKKKRQSSDEDEDDEPESPKAKKQKTVGKTATTYVSKKTRSAAAAASSKAEEPKRRSMRVASKGPGILKDVEVEGVGTSVKKSSGSRGKRGIRHFEDDDEESSDEFL